MTIVFDKPDYIIFLLSTDWFLNFVSSLKPWRDGDTGLLFKIQPCAQKTCIEIFGQAKDYFKVNISKERQLRTFNKFLSSLDELLDPASLVRLGEFLAELETYFAKEGDLSEQDCWTVKTFFMGEVASDFASDMVGAVSIDLRQSISCEIIALVENPALLAPQTKWDVELDQRFDRSQGLLQDYVEAQFISKYFIYLLNRVVHFHKGADFELYIFSSWIVEEVAEKFGWYIDQEKLQNELGEAKGR